MAPCRSTNGYIHLQGGIGTSTSSALYIAPPNAPAEFEFKGNLPIPGCHTHTIKPKGNRVYKFGGDAIGGLTHDKIHSWREEDGSEFRLEIENVPGLQGVGHFVDEFGDGFIWGGGQRMSAQGSGYGPILTAHYWEPGWAAPIQIFARAPYGIRGWYSGVTKYNSKLILPGGTMYEDAGLGRFHQNDFISIDENFAVETIVARTTLAHRIWQNLNKNDNSLILMYGGNSDLGSGSDGDLSDVHVANDGVNFSQVSVAPDPVYGSPVKRHAAATVDIPDGPYKGTLFTTGSCSFWSPAEGKKIWLLKKDQYHWGKSPTSPGTGWASSPMVSVDRSNPIPAGTHVASIGWHLNGNQSGITPMIVRENSQTNYTPIQQAPTTVHDGGGMRDFILDCTTPDDGAAYWPAAGHSLPTNPPEAFSSVGQRASYLGPLPAVNQSFVASVHNDGTICTRWSEG